jgi:hypothetical protein
MKACERSAVGLGTSQLASADMASGGKGILGFWTRGERTLEEWPWTDAYALWRRMQQIMGRLGLDSHR